MTYAVLRPSTWTGRFWVWPTLCCAVAVTLGVVVPDLDRSLGDRPPITFSGEPDGARALLSAITTSMIAVTGTVFSITVVVLQLASSQFSPRVLRTFLRSLTTQLTLGVYLGTFLYSIMVLRVVRGGEGDEAGAFVPQASVTLAFVLVLGCAALFLRYIQHIALSVRVSSIIRSIGQETRSLATRSDRGPEAARAARPLALTPPLSEITATSHGVVATVQTEELVALARRADVVLQLRPRVGEFVPRGGTLVTVHDHHPGAGDAERRGPGPSADRGVARTPEGLRVGPGETGEVDAAAVRRAIDLGAERSMAQDVAFGLRQLVDIAERALSPGVNDPTTAVQVLDELHDLLRRLGSEPDGPWRCLDGEGVVRFVAARPTFAELLDLALEEICQYGDGSSQVRRRVRQLLDDLESAVRPEHRSAVAARRATQRERPTAGSAGSGDSAG